MAQGWYRDPFGVHQDRYFSAGTPTKLVRDDGRETWDPPPDGPLPEGGLIPAEQASDAAEDGSDLRRADEAEREPYVPSSYDYRRAALDILDRFHQM